MGRASRYPPEVSERAVRMVFDSEDDSDLQWPAIRLVAEQIGCSTQGLRSLARRLRCAPAARPATGCCGMRTPSEQHRPGGDHLGNRRFAAMPSDSAAVRLSCHTASEARRRSPLGRLSGLGGYPPE